MFPFPQISSAVVSPPPPWRKRGVEMKATRSGGGRPVDITQQDDSLLRLAQGGVDGVKNGQHKVNGFFNKNNLHPNEI